MAPAGRLTPVLRTGDLAADFPPGEEPMLERRKPIVTELALADALYQS